MLQNALDLAVLNFHIFPVHDTHTGMCSCGDPNCSKPGKHPRVKNWQQQATSDPAQIQKWWSTWPYANIGWPPGLNGYVALDIDPRNGGDIQNLNLQPHELDTITSLTPSGGMHLVYQKPNSTIQFGNARGTLPRGVDVRGDAGYIVVPPSNINGNFYTWKTDHSPFDIQALLLPDSVLLMLQPSAPTPTAPVGANHNSRYVQAVLQKELGELTQAQPGNRNNKLNEAAFNLGTLIPHELDQATVEGELTRVGLQIGLSSQEVYRTIQSGIAAGMAQPRQVPISSGNGQPPQSPTGTVTTASAAPGRFYTFNDLGNARRLVDRYGDNIRYCPDKKFWLVWDGSRWKVDKENILVSRLAKAITDDMYHNIAPNLPTLDDQKAMATFALKSGQSERLNAIVKVAQSEPGIQIGLNELDQNPWLLNVLNGTIDLRTQMLKPFDKNDFITKQAPVNYNPNADCLRWLKFLDEIFLGDTELTAYVQRLFGYFLTGSVREEKLFMFNGDGRTGKGTLTKTFQNLLGPDYAYTADNSLIVRIKKNPMDSQREVVGLIGKRYVLVSEVEENQSLAEARAKELTGGDILNAKPLYSESINFNPTHKIVISGNYRLNIRGTDSGIWERVVIVPFRRFFNAQERDPDLKTKLQDEVEGILMWGLAGCLAWQACGLGTAKVIQEELNSYKDEMDVVLQFKNECIAFMPNILTSCVRIYNEYKTWCYNNGYHAMKSSHFHHRMTKFGFRKDAGKRNYLDIGINQP